MKISQDLLGIFLEIHILWAQHQVHHSSEDYNLAVGLRQSALQGWCGFVSKSKYFSVSILKRLSLFSNIIRWTKSNNFNIFFYFSRFTCHWLLLFLHRSLLPINISTYSISSGSIRKLLKLWGL